MRGITNTSSQFILLHKVLAKYRKEEDWQIEHYIECTAWDELVRRVIFEGNLFRQEIYFEYF